MKTVMFLGMLIGVLLCALVYVSGRFTGATINSPHMKTLEKNSYEMIKTLCLNQVEYIVVNGSSTIVTPAIDQNSKPVTCNY